MFIRCFFYRNRGGMFPRFYSGKIYWCIENDIDIINMSFGTTVKSVVLEKAIKDVSDVVGAVNTSA